jgi:hypothetical protein
MFWLVNFSFDFFSLINLLIYDFLKIDVISQFSTGMDKRHGSRYAACSMSMSMPMRYVYADVAFPCPYCMAISKLLVRVHAVWPCPCSVSIYMLHIYVHSAWAWTCIMDMNVHHGREHCSKDMDMQQGHGHGHAAWAYGELKTKRQGVG